MRNRSRALSFLSSVFLLLAVRCVVVASPFLCVQTVLHRCCAISISHHIRLCCWLIPPLLAAAVCCCRSNYTITQRVWRQRLLIINHLAFAQQRCHSQPCGIGGLPLPQESLLLLLSFPALVPGASVSISIFPCAPPSAASSSSVCASLCVPCVAVISSCLVLAPLLPAACSSYYLSPYSCGWSFSLPLCWLSVPAFAFRLCFPFRQLIFSSAN